MDSLDAAKFIRGRVQLSYCMVQADAGIYDSRIKRVAAALLVAFRNVVDRGHAGWTADAAGAVIDDPFASVLAEFIEHNQKTQIIVGQAVRLQLVWGGGSIVIHI